MTQLTLFAEPLFRGRTYSETHDRDRLMTQQERVTELMQDGKSRTLQQISKSLGIPEASVSARLRDARREIHGGWNVISKPVKGHRGLWTYSFTKGAA